MASATKCVGALLVRNEAAPDRYLQRVLDNAASFVDEIVVLDDGSTDETVALCRAHPKVVQVESTQGVDGKGGGAQQGWWKGGAESSARQKLWALACERAGAQGWVYVFDADHELLGLAPQEFGELLQAENVDCWAFPLCDCWDSEDWHRVDGMWVAWAHPRPWLARALPGDWGERGIHAGHLPWRNWVPGLAPNGAFIRHLGYVKPEHRVAKREKYLKLVP